MLARLVRSFIYPRYVIGERSGPPHWPALEQHWLETDQGPVEHWFVPAPGEGPRPAVLFSHGNGELIDDWPEALAHYLQLGVHLSLVEYRGYGDSAGTPSEARLVDDFVRVAQWVGARPEVDARRTLYHGRSLGGGVVCAASRQAPPAGLILQSTFTSLTAMGRRFGAPGFVMPDRFDNLAALRELRGPCLIFHGTADRLVPYQDGETLALAHPGAVLQPVEGVDHNAPIHLAPAYWERIEALLAELPTPQQ